ncbi:MAG: hypothetical protein ACOC1O_00190 [bacterium]
MNLINVNFADNEITDYISSIEDNTDHKLGISRMKVTFKNGYGISIIRGSFTYGGKEGLFETAIINKDGNIIHDTVQGYLTEEEVFENCLQTAKMEYMHS